MCLCFLRILMSESLGYFWVTLYSFVPSCSCCCVTAYSLFCRAGMMCRVGECTECLYVVDDNFDSCSS